MGQPRGRGQLAAASPAGLSQNKAGPRARFCWGAVRRQTRSNTAAIPWPPPMHIVTSA